MWEDANSHFNEVQEFAKKDENGNLCGGWGAMSDLSHSYKPWQKNFSEGLYLAGVECRDEVEAPEGWTKWVVPGFEYLYARSEGVDTFPKMITYLKENNLELAGAVHDFTDPGTGQGYMYFPIRRL